MTKRNSVTDQHGITHTVIRATTVRGLSACGVLGNWENMIRLGSEPQLIFEYNPDIETTCMACIAAGVS